ncbi:MAG: hypothetical protein HYZ53_31005 [Planctomycetes bacterium]|nr:hypothetical protein [Planctomycetota bacterium]
MPLIVQELVSRVRVGGTPAGLDAEAVEAAVRAALLEAADEEALERRLDRAAHPWREPV